MYFHKCTRDEMYRALAKVNEQYKGNLCLTEPTRTGSVRLRTIRGGVLGSRTTGKGVRLPLASWEAHRDFLIALFDINPKASVRTSFAHYKNKESFEELYPATGYKNIGSMMEPYTMPDLTYEPEPKWRIKPGARRPFYALARKVRKILLTRATAGEWDYSMQFTCISDIAYLRAMEKLVENDVWQSTADLEPFFRPRKLQTFGRTRYGAHITPGRTAAQRLESNIMAALRAWETEHSHEGIREEVKE